MCIMSCSEQGVRKGYACDRGMTSAWGCMGCMEDIKYDEGMWLSCVMKPKKF